MTEDYAITTAGKVVRGREAFKRWVQQFQNLLLDARNETLEVFANAAGDRVVSRWICRGINNGIFGLPADGRPVAFSGIAIWSVREGRLAECWVERSALELCRELSGTADQGAQK
jgi:predicted ester cyclase